MSQDKPKKEKLTPLPCVCGGGGLHRETRPPAHDKLPEHRDLRHEVQLVFL